MKNQTEMERLARPLDPEAWDKWDKYQLDWEACEETLETVRVVLEGLKEPTEEMLKVPSSVDQWREVESAVQIAAVHGFELKWLERGERPPMYYAWQAMLDSILSEEPE